MLPAPAQAATNFVVNGNFQTTTNGNGQMGFNTNENGWTTSGYNFVFASGTADTTGATGSDGGLTLWGPGDGSNNGLPATSPDGGTYIAADGAYEIGAVNQTITGLTAGGMYSVSFWWAGAQQSGFTGVNTEQWKVSLGGSTQSTVVLSNATHGFTGWKFQQFTFIADGASDVLSFLAVGTPNGQPPFSLLDGVTLFATPEPATYALIGLGLLAIPAARKLIKKRS
jgi:hypothetical protein